MSNRIAVTTVGLAAFTMVVGAAAVWVAYVRSRDSRAHEFLNAPCGNRAKLQMLSPTQPDAVWGTVRALGRNLRASLRTRL